MNADASMTLAGNTLASSTDAPLLRVEQLGYQRGGRRLLHDASFHARPGELITLLGPNGAGKSTLLRLLAGELTPHAGRIVLRGKALEHWSAPEVARLRAVMPQHCSVTFPFTAREVVALGLPGRAGGDAHHPVVRDLMQWLGIADLGGRLYNSLSGGEQQRVQLARVLAQLGGGTGPRLLLLDECTSALDPAQQYRIMEMVALLARTGRFCVIAACHDLPLAAAHASRVLLLHQGALIADGDPLRVLAADRLASVYGLAAQVDIRGPRPRINIHGCCTPVQSLPDSLAC